MRAKRENKSKPAERTRDEPRNRFATADGWLLAGVTCLAVITPLVPSEGTVQEGTAAPLHLLWLLALFAWATALSLRGDRKIQFGWTGVALAALVGLHTLSALAVGLQGNGRQALNLLWQFVSYGIAAFLLRQLLTTPAQCRALVAVLIGLAVCLAVVGYYEYFVSRPAERLAFERNPADFYSQLGIRSDAEKQQLRWRIESVEPLTTFALTNSLAGFLVPWLMAACGVGLASLEKKGERKALAGGALAALLIAGCLLLTKSRTALLASLLGAVLLGLYGRRGGWRLGWKIPAAAAGAVVVLGLVVVAVGGLDVQVLSEAPTSVLYRLEYWRATARMIADHPLLGVGPGQFQEFFARYKLPQASETVSDPHNFLLEIWATAGTPALVALLLAAGAFAWQLSRPAAAESPPAIDPTPQPSPWWIYGGAVAGIFGAEWVGQTIGYPLATTPIFNLPTLWVVTLPVGAAVVWLLDSWVRRGELPVATPIVALLALLVNLLAAGATSFPGVFLSAWMLLPIALLARRAAGWKIELSRPATLGILLAVAGMTLACTRTDTVPVLKSAAHLAAPRHSPQLEEEWLAAAQADPWDPRPWQWLAGRQAYLYHQTPDAASLKQFESYAEQYRQRDPRHVAQFQARGEWYLLVYDRSQNARHLRQAIESLRQAAAWYPGRAAHRVRLAWVLHHAGADDEARRQADTAERLDARNPHREQQLAHQPLFQIDTSPLRNHSIFRVENAEQALTELRKEWALEEMP
ncbi:MAG: O-antigen ligase family protein [Pirellulaceae bacterium]